MTPDQPLSIAIAVAGVLLALLLPRAWALLPLGIAMVWHPSTLLLPPPQLALTPTRVIALVLIGRCLLRQAIRERFKWHIVDTAAIGYFLCVTISQLISSPEPAAALNNRAGFFLSALLPYFCARFLLTDKTALHNFILGMLWAALPLALLGLNEMETSYNPWDAIRDYGVIKVPRGGDGFRLFMGEMKARARGPFVQYIMFGWFFALLTAIGTNLYFKKNRLGLWLVPWLVLPLGVISAIASGPMTLAALSILLLCAFPMRSLWKIGFWGGLIIYVAAIGYSNRTPMEIISSFGFDNNSSWYRFSLVRWVLDLGGMNGHWITGYGEVPGDWYFHDLCIHWVWLLVIHGLMGVVGFYGWIAAAGWEMWKAKAKATTIEDQWLLWTFLSMVLGSLAAMLVVALFSETYYFYHLLIGMVANAPFLVGTAKAQEGDRQVGVLAEMDGKKVLLRYTLKPGQKLALIRHTRQGAIAEPLDDAAGQVKVDA